MKNEFQVIAELIENDKKVLDVGCGEGRHIFGVMQDYPMMKCFGLDMDNKSLEKAEEGYEYFESINTICTLF